MTTALTPYGNPAVSEAGMIKLFGVVILAAIMADMIMRLTSGSVTTQYIQTQLYQGVTDPREIDVDSEGYSLDLVNNEPYTPWVSAQFINDGPDSVWIGVDDPDGEFEIKAGESATVNRIGALTRISAIYFNCEAGETATVRVIGEY